MIVWLASYPRSGNTYLRIALHVLYGVDTYSRYNDPLFFNNRMYEVTGQKIMTQSFEDMHSSKELYFVKTHDLPESDNYPAIYLIRDGRDAIVSYFHYLKSNNMMNVMLKDTAWGGWGRHVEEWTNRPNTVTLNFEALINAPVIHLQDTIHKLNLGIIPVTYGMPSFEDLHERWPEFFRRGEIGEWRKGMPKKVRDRFWKNWGHIAERFGYTQV